ARLQFEDATPEYSIGKSSEREAGGATDLDLCALYFVASLRRSTKAEVQSTKGKAQSSTGLYGSQNAKINFNTEAATLLNDRPGSWTCVDAEVQPRRDLRQGCRWW